MSLFLIASALFAASLCCSFWGSTTANWKPVAVAVVFLLVGATFYLAGLGGQP